MCGATARMCWQWWSPRDKGMRELIKMIRDTEQPPYGESINSELPHEKRPLREGYKAIRNVGDMNGNRLLAISYSVQGHIF